MKLDTTIEVPKSSRPGTFRDLGGYRTRTGQAVQRRRLYRAQGGGRFTAPWSPKTVIDLRPAGEAAGADHHLPAVGSLDLDADVVAETLAILTDPWAFPVVLHLSARGDHAATVVATVLGVLGLTDRDIVAETGTDSLTQVRERYGSFDGYAAAIGVASAPYYVRAALLV